MWLWQEHICSIECVYIENGAIKRLAELCCDYDNILLVADDNTFAAAGDKVCVALEDKKISEVIFDGKTVLIPDEKAIERVNDSMQGQELIVGIMMSFAGSSRPASGSEHHLSHFFEIVGIVNCEPYFPHGIDVAYSTVITTKIREEILNSNFPDKIYRLSKEEYTSKMNEIYKYVSAGCISLQEKVGNYANDRIDIYKQKEEEIKNVLSQMPSAEKIEQMLSVAGLDISEFYKFYDEKKLRNAILYAKDLKDRYTVLWLYYDLFGRK